ncbi:Predicted PurR-regulated permease PerM [Aliiroseovarius halocynthiae]|uniref:AI-2E family transporter n=1 Tax=Aliiroseovarius halocynthiae TaxID=985055 RepID=A0A545SM74_9RHOB|nr:AI-2E family transporter [Aliiroseovarius halocynthiae]TQV66063.1 AI-2E family transporter [Aliiroseovarius halocynthiae]SMR83229.1 Predicted PurR-regulated permease PerM [Aliiroseovarius halocynthiae]
MPLPVQTQAKYWSIAIAIIALALWFLGDVIMPFILGGAIAYFLDPVADRLERAGLSRVAATVVISLIAMLIVILGFLLVIPSLVSQAIALANAAPDLLRELQTFLTERFPSLMDESSTIRQSLESLGQKIQERGGELVGTLLSSAMSVINIVILLVVTPVVAFYLLLDWDHMVARIDQLLPLDHRPAIREIAHNIDRTLASFIRGQGTVCIVLGTYYAVALMVVGLNFGLVVGFIAGLITFIPYVGALVGGALAIGLGLFQFWGEWWSLGAVVIIFALGQFFEGNILTPKLVGSSVGLHPVWLMFALSVFGSLFGFVGMLVAVPVAASIGVVARFFIAKYQTGRLYQGVAGRDAALDEDVTK